MIETLASVPHVVWAAIGGSFLTLLGVFLQNIWESKRLREKLKHDAVERNRERQLQLRRDIFLEAAEATLKAQSILTNIARTDKSVTELDHNVGSFDFSGLSKIHLIGSLETIKAFQDLGRSFLTEMFQLLEIRAKYEMTKQEAEELEKKKPRT